MQAVYNIAQEKFYFLRISMGVDHILMYER